MYSQLLTLITDKKSTPLPAYLEFIELCAIAGITSVQLREKLSTDEDLQLFGRALKTLLDKYSIPLIINDHVTLCLELDASGVHLGQEDGDPSSARAILGPDKIIGLSVNTIAQITKANSLPINYVGIGAIFPTKNKPDVETIWDLNGLQKVSQISSHPIVALGGVDETNALSVMNAGAQGIAAIAAFHQAKSPAQTTQNLLHAIRGSKHDRSH